MKTQATNPFEQIIREIEPTLPRSALEKLPPEASREAQEERIEAIKKVLVDGEKKTAASDNYLDHLPPDIATTTQEIVAFAAGNNLSAVVKKIKTLPSPLHQDAARDALARTLNEHWS